MSVKTLDALKLIKGYPACAVIGLSIENEKVDK
jgi:hypothetical protein